MAKLTKFLTYIFTYVFVLMMAITIVISTVALLLVSTEAIFWVCHGEFFHFLTGTNAIF